jgi:hypothetical protein
MSWEGYEQLGRGAVFANYDSAVKQTDMKTASDKFGGVPSMYVPEQQVRPQLRRHSECIVYHSFYNESQ